MAIPRQSLVCLFPALANAKNTKYTKHNLQLRLFHFWQSWFRLSGSQSNCPVASFPSTPSIGFKTLHDFNLSPGTTINLKHLFPPSKINSMSTALLAFVSISINWKLCSWSHVFQCVRASVCVCVRVQSTQTQNKSNVYFNQHMCKPICISIWMFVRVSARVRSCLRACVCVSESPAHIHSTDTESPNKAGLLAAVHTPSTPSSSSSTSSSPFSASRPSPSPSSEQDGIAAGYSTTNAMARTLQQRFVRNMHDQDSHAGCPKKSDQLV